MHYLTSYEYQTSQPPYNMNRHSHALVVFILLGNQKSVLEGIVLKLQLSFHILRFDHNSGNVGSIHAWLYCYSQEERNCLHRTLLADLLTHAKFTKFTCHKSINSFVQK